MGRPKKIVVDGIEKIVEEEDNKVDDVKVDTNFDFYNPLDFKVFLGDKFDVNKQYYWATLETLNLFKANQWEVHSEPNKNGEHILVQMDKDKFNKIQHSLYIRRMEQLKSRAKPLLVPQPRSEAKEAIRML